MKPKLNSIFVDNKNRALKFYTEVLGFEKTKEIPVAEFEWLNCHFSRGSCRYRACPRTEVDDIKAEYERLIAGNMLRERMRIYLKRVIRFSRLDHQTWKGKMGVLGIGLYSGDFAMDLRATVSAVARLPFDADRMLQILCDTARQLRTTQATKSIQSFG